MHRIIRAANWLIFVAGAVAFVNFLFIEQHEVELLAVGALVLLPVFLDALALFNRGQVQVDFDEGSRDPQILTGTLMAGCALALISLLDRGALLGDRFFPLLGAAVLGKGLLWYALAADRIKVIRSRGRLVLTLTIVALFAMPALWVGGSLYQLNKLLDSSPISWHSTTVLDKAVSSGRGASYSVVIAPWNAAGDSAAATTTVAAPDAPVEVTLRRDEFEALEVGMPVEVGVRQGAFGISRVAELVAATAASRNEPATPAGL